MRLSVSRHSEYSVYCVKNSPSWQVKYRDYEKKKFILRRSTGVPLDRPKALAEKAARQLLAAGCG